MISSAISRKRIVDRSEVFGSKLLIIEMKIDKLFLRAKPQSWHLTSTGAKKIVRKKIQDGFVVKCQSLTICHFYGPSNVDVPKICAYFVRSFTQDEKKKRKYWTELSPTWTVQALLHGHLTVYFPPQTNGIPFCFFFLLLSFPEYNNNINTWSIKTSANKYMNSGITYKHFVITDDKCCDWLHMLRFIRGL